MSDRAEELYREFMKEVGIDVTSPDSKDTPRRVAKMFREDFGNHSKPLPDNAITAFPSPGDQYVCIREIPFHSLCAHHHLPYWGKVGIVYHPDKHILGLSKFVRIVQYIAGRPSTQEDITERIAEKIHEVSKSRGVYVHITGTHTCMIVRGVKASGEAVTSAFRGDMNIPEALELLR